MSVVASDAEVVTERVVREYESVRVPAGVAHCLVQVGDQPMTAVAWATAEYDPEDVVGVAVGARD